MKIKTKQRKGQSNEELSTLETGKKLEPRKIEIMNRDLEDDSTSVRRPEVDKAGEILLEGITKGGEPSNGEDHSTSYPKGLVMPNMTITRRVVRKTKQDAFFKTGVEVEEVEEVDFDGTA